MKKYLLYLLFVSFLCACSNDKTDTPRLELIGVFLNNAEQDYSHNLEAILPLSPGDDIDVSFLLDGNGTDLKTFVVKNENKNIKSVMLFSADEVSDEFTDLPDGILGYKDDVRTTTVAVKLTVLSAKEEEVRVGFYLNTKGLNSEGAVYYLDLKTTTQPRVSDEK